MKSEPLPKCRPQLIEGGKWITRADPVAKRDGWVCAGDGSGLAKFVWNQSDFVGLPTFEKEDAPWRYQREIAEVSVPGSALWIGEYYPGPVLSQGIFFQLSVKQGGGVARLFIDDELVVGFQTREWAKAHGCEQADPRTWEIVGKYRLDGAYIPMHSPILNLPADRRVKFRYEYSISDGPNFIGSKNLRPNLGRDIGAPADYNWNENISEDFCYPDHILVHPHRIEAGREVFLSWCTTRGTAIQLNGQEVGSRGTQTVKITEDTDFVFQVGDREEVHPVRVVRE